MSAKSCIIQTCLKYTEKNSKKIKKEYKDFADYRSSYEVGWDVMDLLLDFAKKADIEYTDSMLERTYPMLKLQLKALIARNVWDMNNYYQIFNNANEIYNKGVATIKEEGFYDKLSK